MEQSLRVTGLWKWHKGAIWTNPYDHWSLLTLTVVFRPTLSRAFLSPKGFIIGSQASPEPCLQFQNAQSLWYPKHPWEFTFTPLCSGFLCLIPRSASFQPLSPDWLSRQSWFALNAFHWAGRFVISSGFYIHPLLYWSEKERKLIVIWFSPMFGEIPACISQIGALYFAFRGGSCLPGPEST